MQEKQLTLTLKYHGITIFFNVYHSIIELPYLYTVVLASGSEIYGITMVQCPKNSNTK